MYNKIHHNHHHSKVGMWYEVEILLEEMAGFDMLLQESIMISVLNVCRGHNTDKNNIKNNIDEDFYSIKGDVGELIKGGDGAFKNFEVEFPKEEYLDEESLENAVSKDEMRRKVTTCQWERTLWLIKNYGLRTTNVTESMYTMAMDVCESDLRYEEVIEIYHLMISHKVCPSKSSFSFALRACAALKDGEQAYKVFRGAHRAGAATVFMFNSTLILLDSIKRNEMAVKVLRDILTISSSSILEKDVDVFEDDDFVSTNPFKMRPPPAWLTRRILSTALQNLTENFATYFTDTQNGKLLPSNEVKPFVSDISIILKEVITDKTFYLSSNCYPMANKILLDNEEFDTLRVLLNNTLYKAEINSTRLYDFAIRSLLKDTAPEKNINLILLFLYDVKQASLSQNPLIASVSQYGMDLLMIAMEKLLLMRFRTDLLISDYSMIYDESEDTRGMYICECIHIYTSRGILFPSTCHHL